jgi:hypothetical protein
LSLERERQEARAYALKLKNEWAQAEEKFTNPSSYLSGKLNAVVEVLTPGSTNKRKLF